MNLLHWSRKADTPKTVYVHGAGQITMMQS